MMISVINSFKEYKNWKDLVVDSDTKSFDCLVVEPTITCAGFINIIDAEFESDYDIIEYEFKELGLTGASVKRYITFNEAIIDDEFFINTKLVMV